MVRPGRVGGGARSSLFDDETPLEDFERVGRLSQARDFHSPFAKQARIANNTKQAIIRVTSWSKTGNHMHDRMEYAATDKDNSDHELELSDGTTVKGKDEIKELANEWSLDGPTRKNGRHSAQMVLSFPEGVNQKKALHVVRNFLASEFGENHEYAFAPHTDEKNYHVHAVIKAKGVDGRQLRIGREDIVHFREKYAEYAHYEGIQLDASTRLERGKQSSKQLRAFYYIRKDALSAQTATALANETTPIVPWTKSYTKEQQYKWNRTRREYAATAEDITRRLNTPEGKALSHEDRTSLIKGSLALVKYVSQTKRADLPRTLKEKPKDPQTDKRSKLTYDERLIKNEKEISIMLKRALTNIDRVMNTKKKRPSSEPNTTIEIDR